MANYEHLEPHVAEIMAYPDNERIISLYEDRWIGYGTALKILNLMENILHRPRKLRPECLLIFGDSNMGKTTIIHEFSKKYYTEKFEDLGKDLYSLTKPVIPIQAPAKPSVKSLYINILENFFVPFRVADSEAKLRIQVMHLMRRYETKMLIIDEIHNFLSGTARQQQEVMNTLKCLSNELSLNIVGVGTREAPLILHTDAQYASRLDVIELPKWKLNEDFLRLLLSYVKLLPLGIPSDLASRELATTLFEISGGNLGNLNRLLIQTGDEEITLKTIEKFSNINPTNGIRNFLSVY